MPAKRSPHARLFGLLLGASLALPTQAAQECRYSAEHGAPAQTLTRTLSVGQIHNEPLPALARLVNHGPHDIRLTFDAAAPRQLARGAQEPAQGRFTADVALRSVECLPARSVGQFDAPAGPGTVLEEGA